MLARFPGLVLLLAALGLAPAARSDDEDPEAPDVPEAPEAPESPEDPDAPEDPGDPEAPADPDAPEAPMEEPGEEPEAATEAPPWVADVEYEAWPESPPLPAGIEGFTRSGWDASADGAEDVEGAYLFVTTREGGAYAYRVDAAFQTDEAGARTLELVAFVGARDPDGAPVFGARILRRARVEPASAGDAARDLVREAEASADAWGAAGAAMAGEPAPDDAALRARWRSVVRALERARAKHPEHLGILRDLILAYSRLLPFEIGSPIALNLVLLERREMRRWIELGGSESREEARGLFHAEAVLHFHTGLYPLVRLAVEADPEHPGMQGLRDALESLGYGEFEILPDKETVPGPAGTYGVTSIRAEGEPSRPGIDFHRLTFLASPEGSNRPGVVHFVLAGRPRDGTEAVRWALYSSIAGSKRLVRLYGTTEPSLEDVRAQVADVLRAGLSGEPAGPR